MKIGPRCFLCVIMLSVLILTTAGCSDPAEEARAKAHQESLAKIARSNEEKAKIAAEVESTVYRPRNTNPNAYTEDGGRRTDDPAPQKLPPSAFGDGQVDVVVTHVYDQSLVDYIFNRFGEMGVSSRGSATEAQYRRRFKLGGIIDANEVAAVIDFGDVVSIDNDQNLIEVKADSTRLPHPESQIRPHGSTQTQNYSVEELINSLVSWSNDTRKYACQKLGEMTQLTDAQKEQVVAALQIRVRDVHWPVERAAKEAIRNLTGRSPDEPALSQPEGVIIHLDAELNLQELSVIGGQLASLTGAKGQQASFSFRNGQKSLTIQLKGLDDAKAVAEKLTMFDVVSVASEKRSIQVRLRADTMDALAGAFPKASQEEMAAPEGTPTLASLLSDSVPDDSFQEVARFEDLSISIGLPIGFSRTTIGPMRLLKDALGNIITVVFTPSNDVAQLAIKGDHGDSAKSGVMVIQNQAVNVKGRMAWLKKLRNVKSKQGELVTLTSVTVRVPRGTVLVSITTANTAPSSTLAVMDGILNSISFIEN